MVVMVTCLCTFVQFMAIHMGFHLINGSEGRKYAFAALYKCREDAPTFVFMTLPANCLNIA